MTATRPSVRKGHQTTDVSSAQQAGGGLTVFLLAGEQPSQLLELGKNTQPGGGEQILPSRSALDTVALDHDVFQMVFDQLFSETRANTERIETLEQDVARLKAAELGPGLQVPVTTFVPEPYDVRKTIIVTIRPDETGFVASFFDANIHASGDIEEEALRNLKSLILDVFDSLCAEPTGKLGPEPKRQLKVLREFLATRSQDANTE